MASSNPVWTVDVASKRILEANGTAVELSGYSVEELLEKTLEDLYPPDSIARILDVCAPRHVLDGHLSICNVGVVTLKAKGGVLKRVELFCKLLPHPHPTLLLETRLLP